MKESGNLASLVGNRVMSQEDSRTAELAAAQAAEQWEVGNNWALERLAICFDGLGVTEILDAKRDRLRALPRFDDGKMVQRRLAWIPDNSVETQARGIARIRAVYGDAMLLTTRPDGVEGDILERQEHADSVFYALGVAVEDPTTEQLRLYRVFTQGPGSGENLYALLSSNRYKHAVEDHNEENSQIYWGGARRNPVPSDSTLHKERTSAFANRLLEISQNPTVSYSSAVTRAVHEMLLRDQSAQKKSETNPPLVDLIDWEAGLNRTVLDQTFDTYIKDSPVTQAWL